MADCIIVGCDLHKKNMLVKIAADREKPVQRSFRNNRKGRQVMVQALVRMAMMRRLAIWLWHAARKAQRPQAPAADPS